jgi:hypothetical protein
MSSSSRPDAPTPVPPAQGPIRLAPRGEPLFAQVAPGNAASLRAFLAAGYRPVGAEVLFLRDRQG